MSDASLTFDPPTGTANTPLVLRRKRAWMSSDSWRSVAAGVIALAVHGVVLWVAGLLPAGDGGDQPALRAEETPSSVTIPLEVFEDGAAEDAPAAAPPPPRAAPMSPAMAARIATIARVQQAIATTAAAVAAARAQAASAPVDLSHLTSVRGAVSAGALTPAGAGGNGGALGGGAEGAAGTPGAGGQAPSRPSLAQPARFIGNEWNCPWPPEAQAADIYTQSVIIRVVVNANGSVADASTQRDPGFGFAAAAEACARGQTFSPALDDSGQPVRATTPAMRVWFRR